MQISATRHSLGVSTTRTTGFRSSSAGADLNRDTSRTGGVACGSISRGSGKAVPTLPVSATSTGGADASTSLCTGSGVLAERDPHGRQHLMRVGQSSEDALHLGDFERRR